MKHFPKFCNITLIYKNGGGEIETGSDKIFCAVMYTTLIHELILVIIIKALFQIIIWSKPLSVGYFQTYLCGHCTTFFKSTEKKLHFVVLELILDCLIKLLQLKTRNKRNNSMKNKA